MDKLNYDNQLLCHDFIHRVRQIIMIIQCLYSFSYKEDKTNTKNYSG